MASSIVLTDGDIKLFQKYHGCDFLGLPEYWVDALFWLSKEARDVALPLHFNPCTVRHVQDLLKCPKGECAECCGFKRVPANGNDLARLSAHGFEIPADKIGILDGGQFIKAEGGCLFLENKSCTVYDYRPDACWLFPIQSVPDSPLLHIRVKCEAGMSIIRQILIEAVEEIGLMVLPNLICIPKGT